MVLMVMSLLLFALNGLYYSNRIARQNTYYEQLQGYITSAKSLESAIISRDLPKLTCVAEGHDIHESIAYLVGVTGDLTPLSLSLLPTGFMEMTDSNEFMPDAPPLDWLYIASVLFSLYAILFSYRAISGEREQGTLCLVLSGHVSRAKIICAKYLAIMTTLAIPLLLGMLVSTIMISANVPGLLSPGIIAGIVLGVCTISVYLSVFVLLSLLVSSLVRNSAMVLLAVFSIWLVFTIIPPLAELAARKVSTVRPPYQVAKEYSQQKNTSDVNALYRRLMAEEFDTIEEAKKAGLEQMQYWAKTERQLTNMYDMSVIGQLLTARQLAWISPMSQIRYVLESVSGTGLLREIRFREATTGYLDAFREYVKDKTGLARIPHQFGRWSAQYRGERLKIDITMPKPKGDLDDFPVPVFSEATGRNVLNETWADIMGLVFWNLVMGASALWAFNRGDVR